MTPLEKEKFEAAMKEICYSKEDLIAAITSSSADPEQINILRQLKGAKKYFILNAKNKTLAVTIVTSDPVAKEDEYLFVFSEVAKAYLH